MYVSVYVRVYVQCMIEEKRCTERVTVTYEDDCEVIERE